MLYDSQGEAFFSLYNIVHQTSDCGAHNTQRFTILSVKNFSLEKVLHVKNSEVRKPFRYA